MQIVEHVIISAAGMGSRLGLNIPKCLVEIEGRKLIDYQLDLLRDIPEIRIVVGFMEEAVIEHVTRIRKDVIFVRNPDYQKTTNSYSLYLASRDLKEPFISLDGDVLIDQRSFRLFVGQCGKGESIIGITKSKTEEAVFVDLDHKKNIIGFKLKPAAKFEWSGIAYFDNIAVHKDEGYVYKVIEKHLPLKSVEISCHEIDTPEDLRGAYSFLKSSKNEKTKKR